MTRVTLELKKQQPNEPQYTIQQLPDTDRPRERLISQGPESVSSAELIAIILGSGMKGKSVLQLSQEIIMHFGSLKGLAEATIEELRQIKGLGLIKAIQLKAAITLGLRASKQNTAVRYRIDSPKNGYHLLRNLLSTEKREVFYVILLDTKGYVITQEMISTGTLSSTLVHPREVFYPAIRNKAASVILAHNHPSGDPTPSQQDYQLTEKLIQAGKLIGIPIHDHLIIGNESFVSLRETGVNFNCV